MSVGLRTLVLHNDFTPISLFPLVTIPAEDAVTRIINGTCVPVADYDRQIKTQRLHMNWPSVVARVGPKKIVNRVSLNDESLFYRDHGKCAYCDKELTIHNLTKDHVHPESKGGKMIWENIVAACSKCNLKKGNQLPEGKWKPKFEPYKPTFYGLLKLRKNYPLVVDNMNWMDFIGEWNAEVIVRSRG